MKQQRFEELLFSGKELNAEEQRAVQQYLDEHPEQLMLQEGWGGVEGLLNSAQMAAPRPGFTARWRARLAEHQAEAERVQAIGMSVLSGAAALGVLAYFYQRGAFPPSQLDEFLIAFTDRFLEFLASGQIMLRVALSLLAKVSPAGWAAIAATIIVLPLAWWGLFREFALAKGVSQ